MLRLSHLNEIHWCNLDAALMSALIALDAPVVVDNIDTERTSGVSPVEQRVARAGGELGVAATSIERLPFDLSVLEAGGVFINVDAANFGLLDRRLDWQALGITLPRGSDLAFRPRVAVW